MMSTLYGIYGASGLGQETMDWFLRQLKSENKEGKVFFIDDGLAGKTVAGIDVIKYDEFTARTEADKRVSIAIADWKIRSRLDKRIVEDGLKLIEVRGQHTFVRGALLGEGSVLSAFVDITANVRIGRCFHANTYSYVGHDCVIGDYVTFAPRVSCNGNVHIEDHVYIGTGAIIKQGTPEKPIIIGRGAIVGMGAVVTKSVPPGVTVVGNPARVFN